MSHFVIDHSYLIPLLPLVGAAIAGFFGARWLKGRSHWPIWLGVGASAALSIWLLLSMLGAQDHGPSDGHSQSDPTGAVQVDMRPHTEIYRLTRVVNLFTWVEAGNFRADWGYLFDPLTAVMLCVVCGIGFLICVFAAGYMKGEDGYFRFFAYLGLFIFMMTNLVMGENLIMLYLGWEGVGLCSYLLIGYYYDKPAAREAAKKAFLVNRIGDFGFALGIMLCFLAFGTVSYFGPDGPGGASKGLLEHATNPSHAGHWALTWIPFLLMLGAFGKSAQFPLYVWLPDAMEGPTPVSALIHAATMVTAGVYMIARCGTLFVGNHAAMVTVAVVGAFTAIFAASIALRQFDLKKVFAYSTVSQLGFMFVGVGVFAPVTGVFHLVTHAFFKALLFLSSGVVMHAMAGELDLRKMSGLKRVLPKTNVLMLIGCCALAGFPFLSGFFSKDEIVASAWEHSKLLGVVMLVTAFVTAYYSFRLYFRVFQGPEVIPPPPRGEPGVDDPHGTRPKHVSDDDNVDPHLIHTPRDHGGAAHGHGEAHHDHEPMILIAPLVVLAIGAVLAGYLNWPKHGLGHFLGQSASFKMSLQYSRAVHGAGVAPTPFGATEREDPAVKRQVETLHRNLMIASGLIALFGIYLAYVFHLKERIRADRISARGPPWMRVLDRKYWIDEFYQAAVVEPLRGVGRLFFLFDQWVIDGVVWTLSFIPQLSGFALRLTTQRGYLQGYAVTMLLGIAVILIIVMW
jgi:NADH-quinone oxidoreductase subunit L